MTKKTPNLNLTAFDTAVDSGSPMYDYINTVSGSKANQNLLLLDNFAGSTNTSISTISASLTSFKDKVERTKSAVIQVAAPSTSVNINTGFSMFIPSELNAMNLSRVKGFVNTSGSNPGESITIQVKNESKYSASAASFTITAPDTTNNTTLIDTNYDDVLTDNRLRIYVAQATDSSPLGLQVVL